MKKQSSIVLFATLTLCAAVACSREKGPDALGQRDEPAVVGRTTQCTVPNSDGVRCDEKTCKADQSSDCSDFKDRCEGSNHTYSGNDKSGTCKRGPLIGSNDEEQSSMRVTADGTLLNRPAEIDAVLGVGLKRLARA